MQQRSSFFVRCCYCIGCFCLAVRAAPDCPTRNPRENVRTLIVFNNNIIVAYIFFFLYKYTVKCKWCDNWLFFRLAVTARARRRALSTFLRWHEFVHGPTGRRMYYRGGGRRHDTAKVAQLDQRRAEPVRRCPVECPYQRERQNDGSGRKHIIDTACWWSRSYIVTFYLRVTRYFYWWISRSFSRGEVSAVSREKSTWIFWY